MLLVSTQDLFGGINASREIGKIRRTSRVRLRLRDIDKLSSRLEAPIGSMAIVPIGLGLTVYFDLMS